MTTNPAKIFALEGGKLSAGSPADVTIIDLDKEWVVDDKEFYTRGTHSPFVGKKLKGKAVMTIVDGKVVMKDGKIIE